jgi:nicotinate-nucleotide--dimethylbenzimidazole phosphoribosyltransferase
MSTPFDDIRTLAADLPGPDEAARAACRDALARTEAPARLGRLAETAEWLAAAQGRCPPRVARPIVALYAAAHPIAAAEPSKDRLEALAAGRGAISAVAREQGAGVEVFDLAADRPVPDAAERAAMGERECAATMAFGMEALAKTPDLLILGEAAPGAERAAGALALALFGGAARDWAAPAEAGWTATAAERARAAAGGEPLELLRQLGGRETAALVGAILAAGTQRVPVLLDGYAAAAAAAVVQALRPGALAHCMAGQVSPAPGHARLLDRLGLAALLDLDVAGREGLGGAAAIGLARLACALAAAEPA